MPSSQTFVSVVVAARWYHSDFDEYIATLATALTAAFQDHEIIVVDDGSASDAELRLDRLIDTVPNVLYLRLSGARDVDRTITAGIDHAIGDVIVSAEAVTDPPSPIVAAAQRVIDGTDVVYGRDLNSKKRNLLRRAMSRIWHWYFSRTTGTEMPAVEFELRAVSRRVVNTWLDNRDRDRLLRVMPALSGYGYSTFEYEGLRGARAPGRALLGSVRTGSRTVLAATAAPLRAAYWLALIAAGLNLSYAIYVVLIAVIRGDVVEGWVSLSLQHAGIFILFAIILAILAEYVFQIVQRAHERPLYRVRSEAGSSGLGVRARLNVEHAGLEPPRDIKDS